MRGRLFWPLALITLGGLLLSANFNLLPGQIWGWFWPLLLIILGVSVLFGHGRVSLVDDSLVLEQAASARLKLKHGAGHLELRSGAGPGLLFAGTFAGGIDKHVTRQGDHLDVTLAANPHDWLAWSWPWGWGPRGLDWNLRLNPNVRLDLSLESGASESHLDLADLRVNDLTIQTGASNTCLTLPAQAGYTRAHINSGAASVHVDVPQGVAARVHGSMGLGSLNVDSARFPRRNGGYESPDYEAAANRVELEIEGGVGSVAVR
jgi:Domain of unknown function (DUF5668)/Cell wall-active antibiotics response 4TMS YvqF